MPFSDLPNYEITNLALWQGRQDSLPGERFFQRVDCVDIRSTLLPPSQSPVILGFCCDEGVRRNAGRIGAKAGPDKIREQLAKLACHNETHLLDIGNIICHDEQLEEAQQSFADLISYCHAQKRITIALGGGHDIAWAHYSGLASHYPRLGIINFDAHFDLRPLQNEHHATSGTPFWQIKTYCEQNHMPFDYCCIGIQPLANTQSLFERANDWQVHYLTIEQINETTLAWQTDFLDRFMQQHHHLYLSVCLDVFAESFAPGVSAPQALGLTPWQALPLLKYIVQTGKVIALDIAELSPPLDHEEKTSRLAATILANLINNRAK